MSINSTSHNSSGAGDMAAVSTGRTTRRWRAVIQSLVIAGVATVLTLVFHHYIFGLTLYCLSAVFLISGLFIPPVFNALDKLGRWLAKVVSIGLTWLLLTPFYFLCMFPGRLILLMIGRDPMQRRWEHHRDSYWTDRKPTDPSSYTRQY